MYNKVEAAKRQEFLEKTKAARLDRATDKRKDEAAICIQSMVRRYIARCRLSRRIRSDIDEMLMINSTTDTSDYKPTLKPAVEVYHMIKRFFLIYKQKEDRIRFEFLCRYILTSMDSDSIKLMYVSVMLNKDLVHQWIAQLKLILTTCVNYFTLLKPDIHRDMTMLMCLLRLLVTFTCCTDWRLLQTKQGATLRPGLNKLCENIMGHLHSTGLYPSIQVLLMRGMCEGTHIKQTSLSALLTLSLRPLVASQFSNNLLSLFIINILSIPAVIHYTRLLAPDSLAQLISERVLRKSIELLNSEQNAKIIFNTLEGNYTLCLLANLIQLGDCEMEGLVEETEKFMTVVCRLLASCQLYVEGKQSNLSHWHPVLGWFAQKTDQSLHEAMPVVSRQLSLLWSIKYIRILFEPLFSFTSLSTNHASYTSSSSHNSTGSSQITVSSSLTSTGSNTKNSNNISASSSHTSPVSSLTAVSSSDTSSSSISVTSSRSSSGATNFLKKAYERAQRMYQQQQQQGGSSKGVRVDSTLVVSTGLSCQLYLSAIHTLTQLKLDIMAGLCYQDALLPHLWMLIMQLGPQYGLKSFVEVLSTKHNNTTHHLFYLLRLACDTAKHVISILDDVEMYEKEQPLPLAVLVSISSFLNHFIYTIINNNYINIQTAKCNEVFVSAHSLLIVLYDRDCRRGFTPVNHWLIKELKTSTFLSDLDNNKKSTQFLLNMIPHILPHTQRVVLFRRIIQKEKQSLGVLETSRVTPQSTLITVHRSRLIEDGYRQLAVLQPNALKGIIRVRFVNEQGLDEAGIDQDGVFKEFLEETIKRVFDPSLNLFRVTVDQKLYPSPSSHLLDNHLALFEFIGRMLAKAVYEGIVVEVPFAPFFLSQLVGHRYSMTYSCWDELPSLDPELYKSLTYVKHYEGDVTELDLTFSYDEELLGKIVTHELKPGGRAVQVNNDNRISYLHLMATFKMKTQIKDQSAAFIRGFKSIISSDWLEMFSGPELQKLISGDSSDIDLDDLRRHTQYYGGFHSGHRVIGWLWDILEKDFNSTERSLFLKFVTSCSKPPLLGFAHLEPPFSIRCVEVSDDQDTGDTVGSVLKGFFNIRRRDPVGRLPTSSTCFNLLKLPNYHKKSTLKEKLRYSITSNTGFELS